MKKFNIIRVVALILPFILFASCTEEKRLVSEQSTVPPGVVSVVHVEQLPGGAKITYRLPMDKDLLYVKANYTLANGRKMEVKSSYYNNSLIVEGFADEEAHNIKLYAVNRSEVPSEAVDVEVRPLENPIWETYRSLQATAAFGGIRITAENLKEKDLTIMIMQDSLGEWVPSVDNIYSSVKNIDRTIRGLDTVSQQFAVTVRDKYMNFTDTMVTNLTPLFETPLSKSRYAEVRLPGDVAMAYESNVIPNLWDGEIFHWPKVIITVANEAKPQWITFDTGQLSKMSRMVIWNYPEYTNSGRLYYYGGNLKDFEIWGSTNPNSNGSWDGWVLLGKYNSTKPSGLPYGQQTTEDYELAYGGLSYDFDVDAPKVRYIRIKSNRNWIGSSFMAISEVQVYGDPR